MRALLHNASFVKDVDDVCVLDGAETVGDCDGGAALGGEVKSGLDDAFGGRVEGGGGFVEEQDFGVAEECAGDGEALALAAGEEGSFGADEGGEARGKGHDAEDLC